MRTNRRTVKLRRAANTITRPRLIRHVKKAIVKRRVAKAKPTGRPKRVSATRRPTRGGIVPIPRDQIIRKRIPNRHTLAICAIFNHEDPYLKEWVEFHLRQGVDHFYMYDNGVSGASRAILEPFIRRRLVTYLPWPDKMADRYIQRHAYQHCLKHHGGECFWIAFIDIDEFLYSTGKNRHLKRLLSSYNHASISQIEVPRYNFGNCRHQEQPDGKVVVNYLMREREPSNVKSIVNPANLHKDRLPGSVHRFNRIIRRGRILRDQSAFKTAGGPKGACCPLKVNHYITKSSEEYEQRNAWWQKRLRQINFNPKGARLNPKNYPERYNQVYDDDILHCL